MESDEFSVEVKVPKPAMTTFLPLIKRDLSFTPYSIQWIPTSARLCAVGATTRGTGTVAVYEMQSRQLALVGEVKICAGSCSVFFA